MSSGGGKMKKLQKFILMLLALLLLFVPHAYSSAQENKESFDVVNVSKDGYEFRITVINPVQGDEITRAGLPLGNFHIIPSRKYNGNYVSGTVQWVNPDYIISEGEQTVDAMFNCDETGESVIITVYIYGIENKINNITDAKEISIADAKEPVVGGKTVRDILPVGVIGCSITDIVKPKDMIFHNGNNEIVEGEVTYSGFDNTIVGLQEVDWLFTPNDTRYEPKIGYIEVKLNDIPDEPTVPSLTATTVTLNKLTAYDINLNNKISGSTYNWTSSDTEVVEVNQKNGKLKAVSEGKAIVTCEITLPTDEVLTLDSLVTIGYDENAPELTETILDLEVGDKFDINLENKIAKSKYRWVSSDRGIIRVNSSNGKVTAVGPGDAHVTCTITTPENQVIVLRCDVSVTASEVTE